MTDQESHQHYFGEHEVCAVRMCHHESCTELRVAVEGGAWRELTSEESTDVALLMMEDLIMVDAMKMIHGQDRGLAEYKKRRYPGLETND